MSGLVSHDSFVSLAIAYCLGVHSMITLFCEQYTVEPHILESKNFPLLRGFVLFVSNFSWPKLVNWFPFLFAMCMAWIGAISYDVTWLITIIGYTINVPDSVMGLSFLAVGTSMPEVFSSLIVSRQVNISVSSVKTFSWAFLTASNVVSDLHNISGLDLFALIALLVLQ